jgi:hypothetical protein
MRHSKLALVLIRLNVNSTPHQVLMRHRKWNDWTLVGGHLEPEEKNDWARAAARECEEELAPLRFRDDFTLLPLLDEPLVWGPVPSKSAGDELTVYSAQLFALRFLRSPTECLERLVRKDDFCIVPEEEILKGNRGAPEHKVALPTRALNRIERPMLSWDTVVSSLAVPRHATL